MRLRRIDKNDRLGAKIVNVVEKPKTIFEQDFQSGGTRKAEVKGICFQKGASMGE